MATAEGLRGLIAAARGISGTYSTIRAPATAGRNSILCQVFRIRHTVRLMEMAIAIATTYEKEAVWRNIAARGAGVRSSAGTVTSPISSREPHFLQAGELIGLRATARLFVCITGGAF